MRHSLCRVFLAVSLIHVAACSAPPPQDLGVPDLTVVSTDMAFGFAPDDMAVSVDLIPPPDLSPPPDLLPDPNRTAVIVQEVLDTPNMDYRLLSTNVSYRTAPDAAHDYDGRNAMGYGCFADTWDASGVMGHVPVMDQGGATVLVSGYTPTMDINENKVPAQIQCAPVSGIYTCGWGPLSMMMPGPYLASVEFAPANPVLTPTQLLHIDALTASAPFGAFNVTSVIGTALHSTTNLNGIGTDNSADVEIDFTCPNEPQMMCGNNLVVVNAVVSVRDNWDSPQFPGDIFGVVVCIAPATSGSITIPKAALVAATNFPNGTNDITGGYTSATLAPPPNLNLADANGHPLNILVGRGEFGTYNGGD